jgi:exodeoxyribonuclease VII small subunit
MQGVNNSMKPFDYKKAKTELEEIISWFENSDIDVDEALIKYQKAVIIIGEIEEYLKDAKAKIELVVNKAK